MQSRNSGMPGGLRDGRNSCTQERPHDNKQSDQLLSERHNMRRSSISHGHEAGGDGDGTMLHQAACSSCIIRCTSTSELKHWKCYVAESDRPITQVAAAAWPAGTANCAAAGISVVDALHYRHKTLNMLAMQVFICSTQTPKSLSCCWCRKNAVEHARQTGRCTG